MTAGDLHLNSLYQDPPGCGGFVQQLLKYQPVSPSSDELESPVSCTCILLDILSLSLRISWRFLVPRTFLSVVWARSLVEWWESSTLATEMVALETL